MLHIPNWMFNKKIKRWLGDKEVEYQDYCVYMKGYFTEHELREIADVSKQLTDQLQPEKKH